MSRHPDQLDIVIPGLEQQFIGGQWCDAQAEALTPVISPTTEQRVADVAMPVIAEADSAVAAARRAFDEGPWPRMAVAERIKVCGRLCDALERRLDHMNRAWAFESGATIAHGEMINSGAGVLVWRNALEAAAQIEWVEHRGDTQLWHEPLGPVLGVLTFNGPIVLMGMKVIPALLAGCPVIIKHAPESPLTARLVAEALAEAEFPPGVASVLAADTPVTQHLVAHPGVDMVALTGGTAIGMEVARTCAGRLARTALELGGKSAALITEDVALDEVMATLGVGCSGFNGQVCVNLSRILAPESRLEEIVSALAGHYESLRVGDPFDPAVDRGPLAVERARDRVERYVEGAKQEGAEVVTGGRRPSQMDRGWFYEPTLLRNVSNAMTVAQEEIFGPVTSVISYRSEDEAVAIANDSPFALAASVYCRNEDRAYELARRIRAGGVAINCAGVSLTQPFGGFKQSGWGRECGPEGILEFTDIKQVMSGASYLDS